MVAFDQAIRGGHPHATAAGQPLRGRYYLHPSRFPLDQAPLDPPARHGQGRWDAAEGGDPDGCSPWTCRSGPATTPVSGPAGRGRRGTVTGGSSGGARTPRPTPGGRGSGLMEGTR